MCTHTTPHSIVEKGSRVHPEAGLGSRVRISASVFVLLPVRPGRCLKANRAPVGRRGVRGQLVCCSPERLPAGGAAPRAAPARRPTLPRRDPRPWQVGKWVFADAELQPWQTQTMTHRLDEGLCQRHGGSGVTAQWKTKCFCLPGQSSLCSPSILGHLQAE